MTVIDYQLHTDLNDHHQIKIRDHQSFLGFKCLSADMLNKSWVQFDVKNNLSETVQLLISVEKSPSILGHHISSTTYILDEHVSSSFEHTNALINTMVFAGNKYDLPLDVSMDILEKYLQIIDMTFKNGISSTVAIFKMDNGFHISSLSDGKTYLLDDKGMSTTQLSYPNQGVWECPTNPKLKFKISGRIKGQHLQYITLTNEQNSLNFGGIINHGPKIKFFDEQRSPLEYFTWHNHSDLLGVMKRLVEQTGLFFKSRSISNEILKQKVVIDLDFFAQIFGMVAQLNGSKLKIGDTTLNAKEILKTLDVEFMDLIDQTIHIEDYASLDFEKVGVYGFIILCIIHNYADHKISHKHNDPFEYIEKFITNNFKFV